MKLATLAKKAKLVVHVPSGPLVNGFMVYRHVVGGWLDYYLIWLDCSKQIPLRLAPVDLDMWVNVARQTQGAKIDIGGEAC